MSEFTCAHCHRTFGRARTHEELMAEAESNFSPKELASGLEEICDECYQSFMGWMKTDPSAREN